MLSAKTSTLPIITNKTELLNFIAMRSTKGRSTTRKSTKVKGEVYRHKEEGLQKSRGEVYKSKGGGLQTQGGRSTKVMNEV